MDFRILHRTTYLYRFPVSVGNHIACLLPRALAGRQSSESELIVSPAPVSLSKRTDFFGNRICVFTVQQPHRELVVEARSRVCLQAAPARPAGWLQDSLPWEAAAALLAPNSSEEDRAAFQYSFESPRIRLSDEFAAYARLSFLLRRPFAEALLDFTDRMHRDFRFDTKGTTVRTPAEEVFKKRRGVCQDFAHVQIACLRSLGLAARYVSGYLRTYPPPGKPRLVGADASHAWVSAYCPGLGWLDVDPTNNLVPGDGHVTLAWGRDYSDVSPLRGLVLGGGAHKLRVSVDMEPVGEG